PVNGKVGGMPGTRENWDASGAHVVLQTARRLPSIKRGEREIHDDHVRPHLLGDVDGVHTITRHENADTVRGEVGVVHLTLGEVVISNEHTSELWRASSVGLRRPDRCALATRISYTAISVFLISHTPIAPLL